MWLGKLACRVTSKVGGMGSAERSWGDVKKLKSGQRSHLGAISTNKQATLYGSYCMEAAQQRKTAQQVMAVDIDGENSGTWDDEDMNRAFDALTRKDKRKDRIIRCYMEDWERIAVMDKTHKTSAISKAQLLAKYGGLYLYDLDTPNGDGTYEKFLVDCHELYWERPTKRNGTVIIRGGWALQGTSDKGNEATFAVQEEENNVLHDGLIAYYKRNTDEGVRLEEKSPEGEEKEYQAHLQYLLDEFSKRDDNGKRVGRCAVKGCKYHNLSLEGRGSHRCTHCRIVTHNLCAIENELQDNKDDRKIFCSQKCKKNYQTFIM